MDILKNPGNVIVDRDVCHNCVAYDICKLYYSTHLNINCGSLKDKGINPDDLFKICTNPAKQRVFSAIRKQFDPTNLNFISDLLGVG